jgi:hypothetical protein
VVTAWYVCFGSQAAVPPSFRDSRLECTPVVRIDVGLQTWLLDGFWQQVYAPAKDFRNPASQRGGPKQVHARGRVELNGKVDIACRAGIAACK